MKIAINGFGRIGRAALKIALDKEDVQVVAINDLGELENLEYLLKYDSVYGVYERKLKIKTEKQKIGGMESSGSLMIDDKEILVFAEKDPAKLPWKDLGVDVVLECTGIFTERKGKDGKPGAEAHLAAGAKKVLISAPTKDASIKTIVLGVNDEDLVIGDTVISMASCTTNCIAPMMKVLDENFGVEKSLMSTIHSYTATQLIVDGMGGKKDMRRGRAAAVNVVPSTTGAAIATTLVMPDLKNKFDGMAFRVPVPVGSASDVVAVLRKKVSVEEINAAFEKAEKERLEGIMETTYEPLVSADIVGNAHSVIMQLDLTNVVDGNLVKVVGWYDNEWGYSNRLVEMAQKMSA